MILYKYKSLAYKESQKFTIDSIEKKYLYFSRPSELNDPFDCQIQVSFAASDKEYLEWIKLQRKKMIPGNKLSTVAGIKEAISDPNLINVLREEATEMVEINHICSLTADCFNESMWALYASNYNGICIGYDVSNSENFKYADLSSVHHHDNFNLNNIVLSFEQIHYDNLGVHPLSIFKSEQNQIDNISYNLTHKKQCWNTEQEYRAIIHDTDFYEKPPYTSSIKVFYEDNLLNEVIFGYKVSNNDINFIKQIINEQYTNDVNFYKIQPDLQRYKLIKEPI